MNCDEMRAKLDPYVDGAGSQQELADFEAHLRTCPNCAADAINRLQMKRLTRAAAVRYTPSPEFRRQIEKSIQSKPGRPWAFGWLRGFALTAVALLLVVLGLALWLRRSEREQALAELVDLHVAALASANPVDVISTDRHTVKPWFQGKIPFTFNLPELQNSPFKLLGGRVTYFEHNPSAQLLFQVRSHNLSVFILQDQPGMIPLTMGTTSERNLDFNMETWSEGGLRYVVVSDASQGDVHALGDLLRNAK